MLRARRRSRSDQSTPAKIHPPHRSYEGTDMNRAVTLALLLFAVAGSAAAKDLLGVFEDAVHSDPVIRQADANRLAAREARPQAWAAVLPQLNGTAGVTGDHNSGVQDQVEVVDPAVPGGP